MNVLTWLFPKRMCSADSVGQTSFPEWTRHSAEPWGKRNADFVPRQVIQKRYVTWTTPQERTTWFSGSSNLNGCLERLFRFCRLGFGDARTEVPIRTIRSAGVSAPQAGIRNPGNLDTLQRTSFLRPRDPSAISSRAQHLVTGSCHGDGIQ